MELNKYQEATTQTAIYPESGTGSSLALAYVGLGASNEAGEVAGKIKKVIRDGWSVERPLEQKMAILDEIGDTMWYLSQVANELGLTLAEAAERNIQKLSSRKERGVLKGSGDTR